MSKKTQGRQRADPDRGGSPKVSDFRAEIDRLVEVLRYAQQPARPRRLGEVGNLSQNQTEILQRSKGKKTPAQLRKVIGDLAAEFVSAAELPAGLMVTVSPLQAVKKGRPAGGQSRSAVGIAAALRDVGVRPTLAEDLAIDATKVEGETDDREVARQNIQAGLRRLSDGSRDAHGNLVLNRRDPRASLAPLDACDLVSDDPFDCLDAIDLRALNEVQRQAILELRAIAALPQSDFEGAVMKAVEAEQLRDSQATASPQHPETGSK